MSTTFDPNGVGVKNGNFIGLPYTYENANIILIPVPWDSTVSYRAGTSAAPANILEASTQLDLFDPHLPDAWKAGIYFMPVSEMLQQLNTETRSIASEVIDFWESGQSKQADSTVVANLELVNSHCEIMNNWVYETTKKALTDGKLVGLIGGDHSTPLGYYKALSEVFPSFGILQIDAHQDLRNAYEGFTYSHASIFYNALQIKSLSKLVQIGIRDYCDEENELVQAAGGRVVVYHDHKIRRWVFEGTPFGALVENIIEQLPHEVYISFDIDGLDPALCPGTGTPVPGGFSYAEVIYLFTKIVDSGRRIIGFDLVEVGGENEWDGNVGARIVYKLANLMYKSKDQ